MYSYCTHTVPILQVRRMLEYIGLPFEDQVMHFYNSSNPVRTMSVSQVCVDNTSILYYTILYYTILYYTILYYTILCYTILCYTILCYTILY
jgi:hypothetical protein